MIVLIGDIHDSSEALGDVVASLPSDVSAVVQLGDLWVRPDDHPAVQRRPAARWRPLARPIAFIDGNHHWYPGTRGLTKPTEVAPGLTYLPRGTVLELPDMNGRKLRVGILGGADSIIDRRVRRPGVDWWPEEERVGPLDAPPLRDTALATAPPGSIDLLLTHTPPRSVVRAMVSGGVYDLQQERLTAMGVAAESDAVVEQLWERHGRCDLVCGHMHPTETVQYGTVTVLPILGVEFR